MTTDGADPEVTGLEVERRLNALQTAALDDTLPRTMREAEITGMWNDYGALCLVAAGQLAANRATLGIRAARAAGATQGLPISELRRMVPSGVPSHVREAAIDMLVIFQRPRPNWDELERRGEIIRKSPQPIDGFVALLGLANGLATMIVGFDPQYGSVEEVLRAEALALEQRTG